jgi:outer membrane protein TolC
LAAESYLQSQESALQTSVAEAIAAQALAEQRYRQGLEGIITLQETQRRAFSAQIALLTTSRQRLENRINLHLALGGPFANTHTVKTVEDSP